MSFAFAWPRFSDAFHVEAIEMLNGALNKGNKPRIIADRIEVVELEMGTQPPELEIWDIGDLTTDHFKGLFKLTYAGDAHIVLRTKVQANPLNHKKPDVDLLGASRGISAAHQPLVVPMLLRLSHFRLNAYVVLVVSKQKGITLVFKTDPLQNVDVNSTFDSIAVIQKYIQKEIEGQLREMFREDLPGIIHRLSQRWLPGRTTKVEAPYLEKIPRPSAPEAMSLPDLSGSHLGFRPTLAQLQQSHRPSFRQYSASARSVTTDQRSVRGASPTPPTNPPSAQVPEPFTTFPDLVDYDPTYGLRPEGLPTKSDFSGLGRLFVGKKGLGDLVEETEGGDAWGLDDDLGSRDDSEWDDFMPDFSAREPSVPETTQEFETIPAVGGGTITRPRIFHSQSRGQSPVEPGARPSRLPTLSDVDELKAQRNRLSLARGFGFTPLTPSPMSPRSGPNNGPPSARPAPNRHESSYFPPQPTHPNTARKSSSHNGCETLSEPSPDWSRVPRPRSAGIPSRLGRSQSTKSAPLSPPMEQHRPGTRSFPSSSSSAATFSVPTPPSTELHPLEDDGRPYTQIHHSTHHRKRSTSPPAPRPFDLSMIQFGSPPRSLHGMDGDTGIILHAGYSDTVTQLSALSHLNHTLSPYTRPLEHFTVRSSVPRRNTSSNVVSAAGKQKGRRKRTFWLGRKAELPADASPISERRSMTPDTPSEYSDVDHYFRPSNPHQQPLHHRTAY